MQLDYLFEIALSLVDGIGPKRAKTLIKHCGSAKDVFSERKNALQKIPDIGIQAVRALAKSSVLTQAEKELKFIDDQNIKVLYYENDQFPQRLLHCPDHPIILYSKGNMRPNAPKVLSIVGTRKATPYGKELTKKIVAGFKGEDIVICSGLAFGIDAEAHLSSIDNNIETIGTVAHGLKRVYPKEHSMLAKRMEEKGGLLTEFISDTVPNKENFPRRNRIVAGMSDATLVIESKERGGALITAYQASGYNRDVFAAPGRVGDPFSAGCNLLIQKNVAVMVQSSKDITELMGWEANSSKGASQMELFTDLTESELLIRKIIENKKTIKRDEITATTNLPSGEIAKTLLTLELKGAIKSLPGGVFEV